MISLWEPYLHCDICNFYRPRSIKSQYFNIFFVDFPWHGIFSANTRMIREIDGGGSSHLSQNSCIAHFGLGSATKADSVIVTWVGGNKQMLLGQEANQLLKITEITDDKARYWMIAGILILCLLAALWFLIKRRDSGHRKMNPTEVQ